MKKTLVFALLFVGALALTLAQESKTSQSTAGLFGTDVDDFMDVNSWGNVQPPKLFGFVGAGFNPNDNNGTYDLGFAKQFGSVYVGAYFGGDFGDYTSTTVETTGAAAQEASNSATADQTGFTFDTIVGLANGLGIKAGFKYWDSGSSKNVAGGVETSTDNSAFQLSATAGLNIAMEKMTLSPYAKIKYGYNFWDEDTFAAGGDPRLRQGSVQKDAGVTMDTTIDDLGLLAGIGIDFLPSGNVSHRVDFALPFDHAITAKDMDVSYTALGLHPSYTVKYTPSDVLQVGAKIALPLDFAFGDLSSFAITPTISAGLQWRVKEKFAVNAGVAFGIVSIAYSSTETDLGDGVKQTTSTWNIGGLNGTNNDGRVTISTGFNYAFTQKVDLDFNWNLVAGVFGNGFTSNFNPAPNADGFWGNMNLIFRNQLGFIVVVKL